MSKVKSLLTIAPDTQAKVSLVVSACAARRHRERGKGLSPTAWSNGYGLMRSIWAAKHYSTGKVVYS